MNASQQTGLRIGIDLGGTKIEGLLLGLKGDVLSVLRVPTPTENYLEILDAIEGLVGELEKGVAGTPLPIGIGTPGVWLPDKGVMKNCNSVCLNGRPLLFDLEKRIGLRVRIANDADCFALSEAHDGAGRGAMTVFGVILGTGVGGGFVVDGRLLSGPNGLAGEWGHTPLPAWGGKHDADDANGVEFCKTNQLDEEMAGLESRLGSRQCYCGRLNCIETFLSGPGLARTFHGLWNKQLTAEAIFKSAAEDDVQSRATRELYCHMLARSLAQVINIVDPTVIVLGGGLSNVNALYSKVTALLPRFVFSDECVTPLLAPRWGDSGGVRGAAWLWDAP